MTYTIGQTNQDLSKRLTCELFLENKVYTKITLYFTRLAHVINCDIFSTGLMVKGFGFCIREQKSPFPIDLGCRR